MKYTGCPCGCTSKLPWIIDPDCILQRIPPPPPVPTLAEILAGIYGDEATGE